MKKVLKSVMNMYVMCTLSCAFVWLLSVYKLVKRIDRDVESKEIESLALDDPLVQWMANIDNSLLRIIVTSLCRPYIFIACSNAADKIKF